MLFLGWLDFFYILYKTFNFFLSYEKTFVYIVEFVSHSIM